MWDPGKYLDFADQRARPFGELLGRIGADRPRRVVDLGCGPGNLTAVLRERWPGAVLEAVDSSPEMVQAARERGIPADVLDVRGWRPAPDADVVVCNAVLQWVPGHDELLSAWIDALSPGGWFAWQVPGNFAAPSHTEVRRLAAEPPWRDRLQGVGLREDDAVRTPAEYAALIADAGAAADVWETTYVQAMAGPDPVLEWISGTALRPIRAALDDAEWAEFRADLGPRIAAAYPSRPDGTTWFPFRRVFAVAHKL